MLCSSNATYISSNVDIDSCSMHDAYMAYHVWYAKSELPYVKLRGKLLTMPFTKTVRPLFDCLHTLWATLL